MGKNLVEGNEGQTQLNSEGGSAPSTSKPSRAAVQIKNFMSRVVPWPLNDEPGYINLYWHPPGGAFRSRAFRSVDEFCEIANALAQSKQANLYLCLSRQAKAVELENALALSAIWLNLDPKGYSTNDEALDALFAFIKRYDLPPPSAVVSPGSGIHVFWINDRALPYVEWRAYAEGLKAATLQCGLKCNAEVIADATHILCVPGTKNFKTNPPKPVNLIFLRDEDIDFAADLKTLLNIPPRTNGGGESDLQPGLAREGDPKNEPPPGVASNPLTIARGYLQRGWNPVPVSRRTKKPIGNGWQHRRLTEETIAQVFNREDMNVGVQLGPMSKGLTDVDLDCHEAVAIGPMMLFRSNNIFGRASKPRSHWLYRTTLAEKIAKACLQFKDVDGTMMLELKIGGGGKGSQSVFPGSTHTSGEAIEWDQDGALITIDDDQLLQQVHCFAVAVILARHWPLEGGRHDAALTVGGFLARGGFDEDQAALMLKTIARAAGDDQEVDRVQAGRDAVKQHRGGGETRGFPALAEAFGEKVANKAAEWLGYTSQEQPDPGMEGVTPADFRAYLPDHSYIFTPTGTFWSAAGVNACLRSIPVIGKDGKPVRITRGENKGQPKTMAATAWLDRNQPVHHLTWAPGHPMLIENQLVVDGGWIERHGVTTFNLYRPPTLKHGDPSKAGPWLELAHKVFPEDAERLITKLAHRVQRPGEKINHAVVLGGVPGIGKDTILEPVKRAIGAWNWKETSPQQILGRFNGFLQSVIMRISEVRDLGEFNRYQFYDHTKAYFAAPPDTLRVDEKNIPEHDVMNCTFAILTTNRLTDGIFLPPDDRRHDVIWSELTKDDFTESYWIGIWNWYDEGGDSHVAAYLATLDISAFNPKAPPPKTAAFWSIVNANRTAEEGELQDMLDKLGNPDAVTLHQISTAGDTSTYIDLRNWLGDRKNRKAVNHRLENCGYRAVNNQVAEDGLWRINGRRQVVYAKILLSLGAQLEAAETLQRKAAEEKKRSAKTSLADVFGEGVTP